MTKKIEITWAYIAIAFMFSIAVRLIWVYQFHGVEAFMWNDQFMINTNDGYYWAEGARDLLQGVWQENSLSPVERAPAIFTAYLAKIIPFSFESLIFYLPAFLSSLIVIPIILIAREFQLVHVGFLAALLSSITWSYYNRTMVGYYDTDMLNIVFPTLLLWSMVLALKTKEEKYILFTALEIIAYRWWYPQSYALEFAFFGIILLWTLLFDRKSIYNYKLLALMLLAMIGLPDSTRLVAVIGLYVVYKKGHLDKYIYYLLGAVVVLFFLTGGFAPIWGKLESYIFDTSIAATGTNVKLNYFTVMQTVREAGKIPFETFANRISGHTVTFILSVVGYIWLCIRHPLMLIALPMLGLGFLAYFAGLRFTVYAIPPMALGMGFLLFSITEYMNKKFLKIAFVSLSTIAILYPNIKHVIGYKVPTVFVKEEVQVLDKLKNIADVEDYVVAWWDYGYPIRYYADVKTLIDGGKHSGKVNFPVSYVLTNPQQRAAKMARFDVEYTEKSFKQKHSYSSNLEWMMDEAGIDDANDFLALLDTNVQMPQKTRDIYLYLPFRMMGIFPTVTRFSDMDLMSGKQIKQPFFLQLNRFKDSENMLVFGNSIAFDKKKGILDLQGKKIPIKNFYMTSYDAKGKLIRQRQSIHNNGALSIIFMRSYGMFLIVDEAMFNSSFVQLFVFENYDKRYFEPVILTPRSKIFKLKM